MAARQAKYVLGERIAQGGMAEVHIGKIVGAEGFMRICAMKKVLPQFASDGEFIDMFKAEADTTKLLQHKNIVQVYDFVNDGTGAMLVMEYIDGPDLRSVLRTVEQRKLRIPIELSCYICSEVLSGLGYAHSLVDVHGNPKGIIHRDVSPQNVLISYEGDVKILDFGIAKVQNAANATRAGVLKGKFRYMSPEQASGQTIDARSDVFAVGVVLWEMLTLTRLFRGEDDIQVLQAVRECRVKSPTSVPGVQIPRELDVIVMKLLAKDLNERYQTAKDAARDLSRFLYSVRPDFFPGELADFMQKLFKEKIRSGRERMRTTLALPVESMRSTEDGFSLDGDLPSLFPGSIPQPDTASRVPQPPIANALSNMIHGPASEPGSPPVILAPGGMAPSGPASAINESPPRHGTSPVPSIVGSGQTIIGTNTMGATGRIKARGAMRAPPRYAASHLPMRVGPQKSKALPRLMWTLMVLTALAAGGYVIRDKVGFTSYLVLQPGVLGKQARVLIEVDGKMYGDSYVQLPLKLPFDRGRYQVVVKRPGFQNFPISFEAPFIGRTRTVDVALSPKVPLGIAQFFTDPPDGRIELDDGYIVAQSGDMLSFLPVRHRYTVVVEKDKCPPYRSGIYVPPGASQNVFIYTFKIPGCSK